MSKSAAAEIAVIERIQFGHDSVGHRRAVDGCDAVFELFEGARAGIKPKVSWEQESFVWKTAVR